MSDPITPGHPLTADDDDLLDRLQNVINAIVGLDVPGLSDQRRAMLVGHLTGAAYVTVRNATTPQESHD